MRGKQTIVINGRHYDALTGMPLDDNEVAAVEHNEQQEAPAHENVQVRHKTVAAAVPRPARTPASHAHRDPQRSKTLRRDIVKSPVHHAPAKPHVAPKKAVEKSPLVHKFAPHPHKQHVPVAQSHTDHVVAPIVAKTHAAVHAKKSAGAHAPQAKSSRELKEHMIAESLKKAPTSHAPHKAKKSRRAPLHVSSVVAACLGVLLLGGYLSYINMPNLSVRVAAAQAGLDAHYPGYTPSGYRFDGPVAYSNGRVTLSFEATGGQGSYTIDQQKSTWDSQAVLDNYVVAQTNEYNVNDTQGLTIYTYKNSAAWVNRGVLYTINGDAPLKTEQVVRIATSL